MFPEEEVADEALGVEKTCFVISPIGSRHAPLGTLPRVSYENSIQLWEKVIEPACGAFGLSPIRADRISQPGEIPDQIFEYLRDADVVIADLSGGNANVMYELGLRHTRELPTIQIGEYERLPFDVNTIRTIQFTRTEAGFIDLRNELVSSLRAALRGKGGQLTATRIWTSAPPLARDTVEQAVADSRMADEPEDSNVDEPGFMNLLADGEAAITAVSDTLTRTGTEIEQIGRFVQDASDQIATSDSQGRGFVGRLAVARKLASDLAAPSTSLEDLADEYGSQMDQILAMVQYVLGRIRSGEESAEDARDFLEELLTLAASATEANAQTTGMATSARQMRKVARELREPGDRISRALNRFVQSSNQLVELAPQIQEVLGPDTDTATLAPG